MTRKHRTHESSLPPQNERDNGGIGFLGFSIPTLLTLGGGLVALWVLENQTGAVSRTAGRAREAAEGWWDDAQDWYGDASDRAKHWIEDARDEWGDTASDWGESLRDNIVAGAKATGVAGLLSSLAGGGFGKGASKAAKYMALTKIARYAAQGARQLGRSIAEHPKVSAATAAGAIKARRFRDESKGRMHDAYLALRGDLRSRGRREHEWGFGSIMFVGLGLVAAGIAATYLFTPERRRRELRLRARAAGRQASEWAQDWTESAREWAGSASEELRHRFREGQRELRERLGDEELVSRVRQRLASAMDQSMEHLRIAAREGSVILSGMLSDDVRDRAMNIVRSTPGVRGVDFEGDRPEPGETRPGQEGREGGA